MSKPATRSPASAVVRRQSIGIFGLSLAAVLATACSFDAGKLRGPKVQVRDAAPNQPDTPDAIDAANDISARLADVASEARAESRADVSDPDVGADGQGPGDIALPGDLTDEARGSDVWDVAEEDLGADTDGMDGGGTGGTGGAGGRMGGTGGSGAGGVATDGAYGGGGGGGDGGVDGGVADAADTGGTGPDSSEEAGGAAVDPDLVLWYRFDESSGITAYDSAKFGGVARDATLATVGASSNTGFSTVKLVGTHAIALAPPSDSSDGGGFVVMPALHNLAPNALTIAVWINLVASTANQNWERIFDYADSTTNPNWFNLTARTGATPDGPIFAMANVGRKTADQQLLVSSTALTANVWHHVAIVLPAGSTYTGLMYIDGAVVATNKAMTLHLSDIGPTVNNWLGRSEFAADPYFNGSMDDLRVYKRALSTQEIAALMSVR